MDKKTTLLGLVLTEDNKYALYKVTKLAGNTCMEPEALVECSLCRVPHKCPPLCIPLPQAWLDKVQPAAAPNGAEEHAAKDVRSKNTERSKGGCAKQ